MVVASFLPDTTTPYLVLLGIGFLVGGYGGLAKLRWLVIFGILIILAAVISFQVAVRTLPSPPGF